MWGSKIVYFFLILCLWSCADKSTEEIVPQGEEAYVLNIPLGLPELEIPANQKLTKARVQLGEALFFDPILSRNYTISCATCHKPEKAFADGLPTSQGIDGQLTLRNAPSLLNIGYHRLLFWDGGVISLDLLARAPIENPLEMDLPMDSAVMRLTNSNVYQTKFKQAYGTLPNESNIQQALAAYQRTLLSGNTPYDRYQSGATASMSAEEVEGMKLFFGEKTHCSRCHNGSLFTNFSFENNGISTEYSDFGRYLVTTRVQDMYKFKVPSLRNVSHTAPYMHNGSIKTLEDVIEHYNKGGEEFSAKSNLIVPLGLSSKEKSYLIAFLKTL